MGFFSNPEVTRRKSFYCSILIWCMNCLIVFEKITVDLVCYKVFKVSNMWCDLSLCTSVHLRAFTFHPVVRMKFYFLICWVQFLMCEFTLANVQCTIQKYISSALGIYQRCKLPKLDLLVLIHFLSFSILCSSLTSTIVDCYCYCAADAWELFTTNAATGTTLDIDVIDGQGYDSETMKYIGMFYRYDLFFA